jgi:CRP-like cAMP-binding protein
MSSRPPNNLLRYLSDEDYALISRHLEIVSVNADRALYNPGDDVETVYFPCEASAACFVISIEDGKEVQVVLVGREGAVGGIVSQGRLPAYSRVMVRFGGAFARIPVTRLEAAKKKSGTLANVFARYADCLLAQTLQGSACNAAHSIEQRTAKWILAAMDRAERELVPLSHEQLATMLGVGRSYASRVIQVFKAAGVIETKRLAFRVHDRASLRSKSCNCDELVRTHFAEVLGGIYPGPGRLLGR